MLVTYTLEKRSHWYILAFAMFLWFGVGIWLLTRGVAVRNSGSNMGNGRGPKVAQPFFYLGASRPALPELQCTGGHGARDSCSRSVAIRRYLEWAERTALVPSWPSAKIDYEHPDTG